MPDTTHQHDDTSGRRPDQTSAPEPTRPRHIRIGVGEWRRAAARATREGWGVAELVRELVRAYGAGEIDAPGRPHQPDRTSVRPPARGSNQCSIDPESNTRSSDPSTTTHHQPTPTTGER